MSSTQKASPMHGIAATVALVLPLVCAAAAHAGESARGTASGATSHVRMDAGDALGLEIFADELSQEESAAHAARPALAKPPANRPDAEEAMPAAPDLDAPASR